MSHWPKRRSYGGTLQRLAGQTTFWVLGEKLSFSGCPLGFLCRCLHLLWSSASMVQCIILNQLPFRQHSLRHNAPLRVYTRRPAFQGIYHWQHGTSQLRTRTGLSLLQGNSNSNSNSKAKQCWDTHTPRIFIFWVEVGGWGIWITALKPRQENQ